MLRDQTEYVVVVYPDPPKYNYQLKIPDSPESNEDELYEEEEDVQNNILSFPPTILPYAYMFHMPPATSRPGSW